MAGTHGIATTTRDVKMALDDKTKLLCKLKGSIHFEKILTASSACSNNLRGPSTLALPSWLVQEHSDKLRKSVILRSESSTKGWPVTLSVFFKSEALKQVKFAGGWKAFVTFNGLLEGDSLIFSLTGIAEFEVYVFPSSGNHEGCPNSQAPGQRFHGSGLPRKKARQSYECRVQQRPGEESIDCTVKLNGLIAKKETVEEERAVVASGQSPTSCSLSSYSKDLHHLESENVHCSSSGCHLDSHNGQQPAVDLHDKLTTPSFETGNAPTQHTVDARTDTDDQFQDLTLQKITRNFPLSAFLKQLTASNFCRREGAEGVGGTACMEIPVVFWRTYGSRVHSQVKLQGIREESLVRTVACLPILQGDQTWRLYLRSGWREFADGNNLQCSGGPPFVVQANSLSRGGECDRQATYSIVSEAAETGDATMARNVKMPLSSEDKAKVLRKLQGSIHFEKTLTAWSASRNHGRSCGLALPFWLVEKHGDKFRKSVILRAGSSTKAWPVTLSIYLKSPTATQVKFSGGWKDFATFNGLLEGDSLIFSLTAMSEFKVYVFRSTANPKGFPSQAQRKWTCDSESSRRKAKQPCECREEQLAAEGSYEGKAKLNGLIAKKETLEEGRAVFASDQSPTSCTLSSYSKGSHLLESENVRDSLSRGQHGSNIKQEPVLNRDEVIVSRVTGDGAAYHTGGRKNTGNEYQGLTLQKITRNCQLPVFLKKLTVSNICRRDGGREAACLEIPLDFWNIFGSRIHSLIKLQGIRDESLVRTMACLPTHGMPSRHYLRAEWRDFANENNLKVGQELLFSLAADSFFVVREVLPHPHERLPKIESI